MGESAVAKDATDVEADISDEAGWVVVKTLLDANTRTTQALEHHLLRTYYQERGADLDEMQSCIDQAIEEHERIIEDLKLTSDALAELDGN